MCVQYEAAGSSRYPIPAKIRTTQIEEMKQLPEFHFEPLLRTRECEELEVWSDEVGWETDYRQLERGKFDAWFAMAQSGELSAVEQYCNRQMSVFGVPPRGCCSLVLPLNHGARGIFQGKELTPNQAAVIGPGVEGTYRTPRDLRLITLNIPMPRLRAAFGANAGEILDPLLRETRLINLTDKIVRRMTWIARQVIEIPSAEASNDGSEIRQRELEEHFTTALISGLNDLYEGGPGNLARKNHVKHVIAARNFIESHLDAPLGLETLARETGVSPRTLEYAFRRVYDTTPLNFIKVRRLHAARRRLLESDDPELTVTKVALGYGFQHFSYFARDYRLLFGELPSNTLQRARH